MKINILDAHDRLKHFNKQGDYISQGCMDCIRQRPEEFGNHPFYIFAHARTEDDGVSKRMIWQPRLVKPKAQTNSMLFKSYPETDMIKVIWMIPARELWNTFEKGKLTENQTISESIHNFIFHRDQLEMKEADDLEDYKVRDIYDEISRNANLRKTISQLGQKELPNVS